MKWLITFLKSSIGKKLLMSLTGLFLIMFLPVHLIGNFKLLADDGGEKFNLYAQFMTTFTPIKLISYGLYFFILLHTFQGILLWISNWRAKGKKYKKHGKNTRTGSRFMAHLGILIFIFLAVHLYQFWFQMKIGALEKLTYEVNGVTYTDVKNLYAPVQAAYSDIFFVIFYVACMIPIAFHLYHGFQSAFQTLGLNHKKYTPLIRIVGTLYSIVIPLGFAYIPVYMYLFRNLN
ncbi:MAG: succinate dehydrogenase cytochrome b subunit [Bacteroidota bacterium]